jgi:alkylated DNA repair dioxygenase AlkB
MQLNIFSKEQNSKRDLTLKNASLVKGLQVIYDYLSDQDEDDLLLRINAMPWLEELSRRVQHYGYKYDYKSKKIDSTFYLGDLPSWLDTLGKKLVLDEIIDFRPDQAIINEYLPGQGISPHIDCEPCFGDTIVSLSLGSACVMNFEDQPHSKDKVALYLEPKSLVVMRGESRYNWHHGIPARKKDLFNGVSSVRQKRISITFRQVNM